MLPAPNNIVEGEPTTMSTDQPKQSSLEQTPKSIHNVEVDSKLVKVTFDKEKMLGKMEQQIIRKKIMRTILATYPPILDEQSIPSETNPPILDEQTSTKSYKK